MFLTWTRGTCHSEIDLDKGPEGYRRGIVKGVCRSGVDSDRVEAYATSEVSVRGLEKLFVGQW